jgi:molybdopterin-guanine dinucleotide biosynthesis protein
MGVGVTGVMAPACLPGAVLAGGGSRRFGTPKALAPVEGEPMLLRAVRLLRTVADPVLVSTGVPELAALVPGAAVPDRRPGLGPLAGLDALLREARARSLPGLLVLGCDMPLVPPALLVRLRTAALESPGEAVVVASGEGWPEPLCGWYPVSILPEVARRLEEARSDLSLRGLLASLEPRILPPGPGCGDPRLLRSANTREELAALLDLLPGRTGTRPPAVAVVGWKDSGKTSVAVGLVVELRRRGFRVGAVKHGHGFRLDTPGTDSWRMRQEGGADPVLLTGPAGFALMGGWDRDGEPPVEELLERHFGACDVVVVEGFKGSGLPRVEVFRPALHPEPIHGVDGSSRTPLSDSGDASGSPPCLLTMVTDDPQTLEAIRALGPLGGPGGPAPGAGTPEPEASAPEPAGSDGRVLAGRRSHDSLPVVELDDPLRSFRLADLVVGHLLTHPLGPPPTPPLRSPKPSPEP